jgi:hypothetical protein
MAIIFNNTFSGDKHIIYPATWGTGKTSLDSYN